MHVFVSLLLRLSFGGTHPQSTLKGSPPSSVIMKAIRLLFLACTVFQSALAAIEFTEPAVGTVLQAGHVVTAHWKDSGVSPRISDLVQYDLYLCALWDAPGATVSSALDHHVLLNYWLKLTN